MIYIKVDDKKGGLEKALKKLKEKFKRTKVVPELRERSEFKKPSVARRAEKLKAIYRQRQKSNEENNNY